MAICSGQYEDLYISEPEAPSLSLGERVSWNDNSSNFSGTIRWIGRIPQLNNGWTVGVEFDQPIQHGGNGYFNRRHYFSANEGHALFLPAQDLLSENDGINESHPAHRQSEHGTCYGRYPPPCRDATYGHFRPSCHSRCNCYDYECDVRHCDQGPIYGRISTRQPYNHREQPYESYYACHPVQQDFSHLPHHQYSPVRYPPPDHIANPCQFSQYSNHHTDRQSCCYNEQKDIIVPSTDEYKEPFFNPRSTIKLINGFKEWVTCWVLGTAKRRKKKQIMLQGRSTVTSLIVTNTTPGSLARTGQRLSAFANYASVNECVSMHNDKDEEDTSSSKPADNPKKDINGHRKSVVQNGHVKQVRSRKRRAPLPPTNNAISNGLNSKKQSDSTTTSSIGSRRSLKNEARSPTLQNGDATSKSTSAQNGFDNSVKLRKSPKKRRAPLPPGNRHQQETTGFHENFLKQAEKAGILTSRKRQQWLQEMNFGAAVLQVQRRSGEQVNEDFDGDVDEDGWAIIPKFDDLQNADDIEAFGRLLQDIKYAETDASNLKAAERKLRAFTLSSDDSDVDVPNGVVAYEMKSLKTPEIQHKKNDKRIKISIEKREMNVVTVEELQDDSPADQSSISELSDNDNQQDYDVQEDRKSTSSEEVLPPSECKPIFDEVQLTPQGKASVKDFVNAFNMLADREKYGGRKNVEQPQSNLQRLPQNLNVVARNDIQSFPTNWQYQRNGSFPGNRFLVPIQEESQNDSSEAEGKEKVKKSTQKESSKVTKEARKSYGAIMKEWDDNHRKHEAERNFGKHALNMKPQASDVAISSLLNADPSSVSKGAKSKNLMNGNGATSSRAEQPIVVSLYIEDKSSHRGPIPFIVFPSMSLRKLKKKIEKEYNFDKDLQCWILGETFAIHDEASLASYGVVESGCPILLYVMAVESKKNNLPPHSKVENQKTPIYEDVAKSSTDSETEEAIHSLDRRLGPSSKKSNSLARKERSKKVVNSLEETTSPYAVCSKKRQKEKAESTTFERKRKEHGKKKDYHALVQLDNVDLVTNFEQFECPICFLDIEPSKGVILQECLHSFCKECLAGAVEYSDTAVIKCPFRNDEYSCESHLQDREVKALVSPEIFERHLQRSMALAESQAKDSFHCKTPDCPGWCLYEDNVNMFFCPVCRHTNCLTCNAMHEGRNCRQYQDDVSSHCDSNEEAKKTKDYLEKMVQDGEAMKCPKCQVILMKKWGCDWLKCSMCHTEVCWVTKGPRWGPNGRGDTSGGCKCMLSGVRCHPKCSYCH